MTIPEQEMPERIYAAASSSQSCVVSFDTPSLTYNVEYIRADVAALTAAAPYMSGANKTTITECIMDFYGSDYAEGKRVFYNPYTGAVDAHDLFIFSKPAFERKVQERILSALEPSSARDQALEEAEHAVGSTVLMHHASDYEGLDSLEAYEAGQLSGLELAQVSLRALKSQLAQTGGGDE